MSTAQSDAKALFEGKPNYWLVWEFACNIALALFFLRFVVLNGADLFHAFRLSTLLVLVKVSADTLFHLVRAPAKQITKSYYAWFIGIAGAFTILFFQSVQGSDMHFATGIQIAGLMLQVAAMFSLNRSIGFVAANRGIKTNGMYRFVRHPLYFAYTVAFFGYLLNHFTTWNLCVYLIMVLALYLRTYCEERVLREDAEYQEYAKRVRWRVLPFVA